MSRRNQYVVASLAAIAVWFCILLVSMGRHWDLIDAANVGNALAPAASLITVLALVFAFQQNGDAADRALRDKLADAYAAWFREARVILKEMVTEAQDLRFKVHQNRGGDGTQGYLEARGRILRLSPRFYELHVASTEVLLLEDREDLRKRIEAIHAGTRMGLLLRLQTILSDTVQFHVALTQRQTDLENLFSDVVVRLRSGARPEPATPPASDEDPDVPVPEQAVSRSD